jgi:hypothetical protein
VRAKYDALEQKYETRGKTTWALTIPDNKSKKKKKTAASSSTRIRHQADMEHIQFRPSTYLEKTYERVWRKTLQTKDPGDHFRSSKVLRGSLRNYLSFRFVTLSLCSQWPANGCSHLSQFN